MRDAYLSELPHGERWSGANRRGERGATRGCLMCSRLPGFDYSMPYFYMVTIRRNDGYPEFSRVCGDAASHYLAVNRITP